MDERMDIRVVTEENVEELAELTGRPVSDLLIDLLRAKLNNQVLIHVISKPGRKSRLKEKCIYDAKWTEQNGWVVKCVTHGKPSYHSCKAYFDGSQPCIEVDPYYPNGEMG